MAIKQTQKECIVCFKLINVQVSSQESVKTFCEAYGHMNFTIKTGNWLGLAKNC